ncbi:unnamed protein product [Adineta ricciae]|uniref:Uncharacterized protein n=1 Tax=Adineta ricciae TaxID=249248 RepID=A0A814TFU4_ADIRI|nr:unnamed protein product [Adineta ricciae]
MKFAYIESTTILLENLTAFVTTYGFFIALIFQAKSPSYTSVRFRNYMNQYKGNQNARHIINYIQTKHGCCGENNWMDWSSLDLKTVNSGNNNTISTNENHTNGETPQNSHDVYLPPSCCTMESSVFIDISSNLYCPSHFHNLANNYYPDGCLKKINRTIILYTILIIIINSFLIVFSFIIIPIVFQIYPNYLRRKTVVIHQLPQDFLWYSHGILDHNLPPVPCYV